MRLLSVIQVLSMLAAWTAFSVSIAAFLKAKDAAEGSGVCPPHPLDAVVTVNSATRLVTFRWNVTVNGVTNSVDEIRTQKKVQAAEGVISGLSVESTSGNVVSHILDVRGQDVTAKNGVSAGQQVGARKLVVATDPAMATPGTIQNLHGGRACEALRGIGALYWTHNPQFSANPAFFTPPTNVTGLSISHLTSVLPQAVVSTVKNPALFNLGGQPPATITGYDLSVVVPYMLACIKTLLPEVV